MLAGLIGALIGVVGTNADSVRWPGPVLVALAIAVLLLLASLQAWIRGQAHLMTLKEVEDRVTGLPTDTEEEILAAQTRTFNTLTGRYRAWTRRSLWSFQLGLSLFLVGLSLVVLPSGGAEQATWRWIGAGAVLATAVAAAVLTVRREWKDARHAKQLRGVTR